MNCIIYFVNFVPMKKLHVILIVMLGFLLTPAISYACESKNHSSNKEVSSQADKDCCADHNHSKSSKDCNGKCGDKSCGCSSGCVAGATLLQTADFIGLTIPAYFFKANFYYPKNLISSGFNSLWLIPKIN